MKDRTKLQRTLGSPLLSLSNIIRAVVRQIECLMAISIYITGFGGNVVREEVKKRASWYVTDFQELISFLTLQAK